MYNLSGYASMVADRVRIGAYEKALAAVVKRGSVVLDLGAGTGIMALFACRFGAARVYAIEPADSIALAQHFAQAAGYADRITFFQVPSEKVELPEQVDVIVSDLRGVLPLFMRHLPVLSDAVKRFLKTGGRLIPKRDRLWIAPAKDSPLLKKDRETWSSDFQGFDLSGGWNWACNVCRKSNDGSEVLAGEPRQWATIEYGAGPTDFSAEREWSFEKATEVRAFLSWFDTDLVDGVGFSCAPGAPEAIYGRMLFPLREALYLMAGDILRVEISARLRGEDYLWSWKTAVLGADGKERRSFTQSTALAEPITPAKLAAAAGAASRK